MGAETSALSLLPFLLPSLGTHLAARGLDFFWTWPCVRLPSPGLVCRTQKTRRFTSWLPPWGLLAGSPEATGAGAGCGGRKVGAGSPGPLQGSRRAQAWLLRLQLSFYELQREAKFPQPPNETESKSELIGNRREGEELGPGLGWQLRVQERVCEDTCVRVMGLST